MVAFTLTPEHRHQRLAFAITRQQHDARSDRLMGRDQRQLLAVADDPPGLRRLPARQAVEELGLPVAFGAGDPHDLAALQREADRPERLALQAVDHEHLARFTHLGGGGREGGLERAADDQLDELRLGRGLRVEGALTAPVAQDGDAIGDLEDLGQTMADVHHPDATPPARGHRSVQRVDLVRPEGGGGLVEQQHQRIGDERLRHLEELTVREAEGPRRGVREELEVEVELREEPSAPTSSFAGTGDR